MRKKMRNKSAQKRNNPESEMTTKVRSDRHETQKLEGRYGEIGISAVAAAMQCRGDAKVHAGGSPKKQGEEKGQGIPARPFVGWVEP